MTWQCLLEDLEFLKLWKLNLVLLILIYYWFCY
jgi:hypothetical protein